MQAVIMAGGFGTRLRPLSCNMPKPMVPIANRPMLYHVIELLKKYDFNDVVMMLYYQPEVISNYFGDGKDLGVKIHYLRPEMDLGTAGSVRFAREKLKNTFIVISGDVLTDFDLSGAVEYHKKKKAMATMVLTRVANPLQYGVVITAADGKIERFLEKPSWGEVFSDTINTGIYVLEPEVLDLIPEGKDFDFSKDLYPILLKEDKGLYGYIAEGYWKDIGNLDEYRLAHYDILDGKIKVKIDGTMQKIGGKDVIIGSGTKIEDSVEFDGPAIIGSNTIIGKGTKIGNSVIGSKVRIAHNSNISGTVLWNGVDIGREVRLKETVIGEKTIVRDRAVVQVGTVIADQCSIGSEAVIRANLKIWPHKLVEDGATLSTSLVWGEKWNRSLFGAYGITGLGNIEITPEFATKVGAAYGAYLGEGGYVITSRDAHMACRMIKRAMIAGLLSAGVRVGDLRTAPIPVVRYEMGKEGETGGIHVRQSPYDPRIIDMKFFNPSGSDISIREEKSIEQLFLREDHKRTSMEKVGDITVPPRAAEYYKAGYLKAINRDVLGSANLKMVLDYAYSSASLIFPAILGGLNLESVALNAYLNPDKINKTGAEFKKSLRQLSDIVMTLKADSGFLIDTGAEKVFIVDEKGRILPDDQSLMLVANLVMRTFRKGTIAVPVHVTSAINAMAQKYNVKVRRTGSTPRQIMEAAREKDVVFVGDCLGGFIFPEFMPSFDAMYAIGKILEMMAREKVRLSHINDEIPASEVLHKKLPCSWEKKGQAMRYAMEDAKGKKTELVDGVKVYLKNGWVLLLPDPDEAYFHVWAESPDKKLAEEYLSEYVEKVKSWQGGDK